MLLLDDPMNVSGLSLFRDHVAADTFHYLPGAPVVAEDEGRAGLRLVRYRGGQAGGLLTLTVELTPPTRQLDAARAELSRRFGADANLVPVLFTEGTVRLLTLGADTAAAGDAGAPPDDGVPARRLVEQVLGTATPSLLGRQRAVFSVRLDAAGATLVAGALGTGTTPILAVYDLSFHGLRLARGLRATVNVAMAYEHLRTRFAPGALVFRADLDHEAEVLARDGHIRIEDVDYTGTDPVELARRQEQVIATLHETAEALFFRHSASPLALDASALAGQPDVQSAWAAGSHSRAAFVLRALEQADEQELTYDLTVTAAVAQRVAPQGAVHLPAGSDATAHIVDVDLEDPPAFDEVVVLVAPGSDWTGVDAVHLDVQSGEETRTVVLSRDVTEGRAVLPAGTLLGRWRVLTREDPEALGHPGEADTSFAPLTSRQLIIDPSALAGRRLLRVALGDVDPIEVQRVEGRLILEEQTRAFVLDEVNPEIVVPVWGRNPLALAATLHLRRGGSAGIEQSVGPLDPVVLVHQPPSLFRVVMVELVDPLERYTAAFVELEGLDGRGRRLVELGPGQPGGRWSLQRQAGDTSRYRYRVRTVRRDARVDDGTWTEAGDSLLLVGDHDITVTEIDGVLLGAAEAQGALVTLTSLEPASEDQAPSEIFLGPGEHRFRVRLGFRRGSARRYRVEGQVFLPSGAMRIDPVEEESEVVLLAVAD